MKQTKEQKVYSQKEVDFYIKEAIKEGKAQARKEYAFERVKVGAREFKRGWEEAIKQVLEIIDEKINDRKNNEPSLIKSIKEVCQGDLHLHLKNGILELKELKAEIEKL